MTEHADLGALWAAWLRRDDFEHADELGTPYHWFP
jgi:hypothetical protein